MLGFGENQLSDLRRQNVGLASDPLGGISVVKGACGENVNRLLRFEADCV